MQQKKNATGKIDPGNANLYKICKGRISRD
jgi:hypothetical protein